MGIQRLWKMTIGILTLSFMFQYFALAEGRMVIPEVEIQSVQAYAGQSAAVDIVINRPKGLKTFEFQLHYDHAALELSGTGVKKGKDVANWLYEYKVDQSKGTMRVAAVNTDGFQTDGQAVIMRLTFKAIGTAGTKSYSITDLKAFTDVNHQADIASKTGTFTIMNGSQPTPTPNPTPTPTPSDKPVDPNIEDDDLQASVSIDNQESIDIIINNGQSANVTVKVEAPLTASSVKVSLDKVSVNYIDKSGKTLIVQTPIGEIELDAATLAQAAGKDLVIMLAQAKGAGQKPIRTISILADGKEIVRFAGKVKVSIPYYKGSGESNENIILYRLDGNQRVIVPQSKVGNGNIVFITQIASTFEIGYNEKTFTDMADHWSKPNIEFVTARELFLGVASQTFGPEQTMTRGMLATVLGRMVGIKGTISASGFTDVEADRYYAPYIAYASENGIVNGIGDSKFAPDREVTREEMAKMIASFMKHIQLVSSDTSENRSFEDEDVISAWAAAAIKQLQAAGILDGKPGNQFDPKGNVTRAEVAKVIRILIELTVR